MLTRLQRTSPLHSLLRLSPVRCRSTLPGGGERDAPNGAILLGVIGFLPFGFYAAQHASERSPAGRKGAEPWGDTLLRDYLAAPLSDVAFWALGSRDQAGVRARFNVYSATILSFVGALHWGVAAAAPTRFAATQFAFGVMPQLVAWVALTRPRPAPGDASSSSAHDTATLMALCGGYVGIHFLDVAAANARPVAAVPPWFVGLRTPLTSAVLAAHCLAMYAIRDPSISDAAWMGRDK
jgi:hypothetical protein